MKSMNKTFLFTVIMSALVLVVFTGTVNAQKRKVIKKKAMEMDRKSAVSAVAKRVVKRSKPVPMPTEPFYRAGKIEAVPSLMKMDLEAVRGKRPVKVSPKKLKRMKFPAEPKPQKLKFKKMKLKKMKTRVK